MRDLFGDLSGAALELIFYISDSVYCERYVDKYLLNAGAILMQSSF
jgi:hypothetical protein